MNVSRDMLAFQLNCLDSALAMVYKHCPDAHVISVDAHYKYGPTIHIFDGVSHVQQLALVTNTEPTIRPCDNAECIELDVMGCKVFALYDREAS